AGESQQDGARLGPATGPSAARNRAPRWRRDMSAARWESCAFALPTDPRDPNRRHVWGIAWGVWGIAGGRGAWTIFHRASGKRLTTFTALGKSRRDNFAARRIAKEFCFQIDGLADWST